MITFIRIILSIGLLFFVYEETGTATTLVLGLILLSTELNIVWVDNIYKKVKWIERKIK